MDRDSLIVTIRGMIAQNPVEVSYAPAGGVAEAHDGGVANVSVSERQLMLGRQVSYIRSVWIIQDDWTEIPAKRKVISINVDGVATGFRVLDFKEYYPDTAGSPVARRLDLGAEFELGRD